MPPTPDEDANPWADLQAEAPQALQSHEPVPRLRRAGSSKQRARRASYQRTTSKKYSTINCPTSDLLFGVVIVNFHHLRGPEVEYSILNDGLSTDQCIQLWPYLPFQALPDGAHSYEETFSYFTLKYTDTTLFAISCARQIRSDELLEKDDDVTRSSVQKSIVVILRQPLYGQIKEKLSIVTKAFFEQKNFNDKLIVDILYQNLKAVYNDDSNVVDESDFYSGLSVNQLIKTFKKDTLTIIKAILLEKKIAFFSANPTLLCQTEYSFISLIPNLINNLQDSSAPELCTYAQNLKTTTSFQSSDRNSVLSFAGLPLQPFGLGGIFSPYSPLQQFEELKGISYYTIGTSNALLLNQKLKLCDVLINIDTRTIEILNLDLIQPLTLSSYDKKWISHLINNANLTNNVENYSDFLGSDDYIRWQFEDYFTSLLSCVKYDDYLTSHKPNEFQSIQYENQIKHFNMTFINSWRATLNFKLFHNFTDDHIFDVFEPHHIYSEENKSLSERFQLFTKENTKKLEEYKKGFFKDQKENDDESSPKDKKPPKIWSWYKKKDKDANNTN